MRGWGLADPCPHFLWGHTSSEMGGTEDQRDRGARGQGAAGPRLVGACLASGGQTLPAAKAGGQEDRAIIPTHTPLGHQRLLASLHLLPQALCTAVRSTEVLRPTSETGKLRHGEVIPESEGWEHPAVPPGLPVLRPSQKSAVDPDVSPFSNIFLDLLVLSLAELHVCRRTLFSRFGDREQGCSVVDTGFSRQ